MKVLSGYEFQHHQRVEEVSTKNGGAFKKGRFECCESGHYSSRKGETEREIVRKE